MEHVWTCRCCGKQHHTLPIVFSVEAPIPWLAIPEAQRDRRAVLSSDQCTIDDKEFYLRGCLEIPIIGRSEVFVWGVWVSVSEKSFARVGELWKVQLRDQEPPFFGWLSTELPVYPRTNGLKTNLHLRNDGQRPFVEVEPTDHPLAVEQRQGLPLRRVEEIASTLLRHS